MSSTGAMVQSWPFIPGCDAAGTVVKVGANAVSALGTTWKTGDRVFGCTRLGVQGYTPWAEYFLFDAAVCIPLPDGLSLAEAAGTGVGLFTAALGVFDCLEIPLLDPDNLPGPRDEWAVVFGGAGSVGQFAVQLLRVAGFKVAATSSVKSFDVRSVEADEKCVY
jgi:NADPH:quinone reductase-like Zn-dependent oxidoreductase